MVVTAPLQVSEHLIEQPVGPIFVKRWTPPRPCSSTAILLLHDSLGCVELWKDFPEKLSRALNRTVIAYDRWGFGKSAVRHELPPPHFIHEEAEIFLPRLLHTLNLSSIILFGHSVGGAMAIAAASRLGTTCRAVITESAQAFVEEKTKEGIRKAERDFMNPKNLARLEKYHGAKTGWVLKAWTDIWLSEEFAPWTLKNQPPFRSPLLVIHGDQDDYGSVEFPKTLCTLSLGKTQMVILPQCGHVPHREHPETVITLVRDFLQSLPPEFLPSP